MGSVNLDNTGSGSAVTLSSDGTSLLLDGTAVGGGGGFDSDLTIDGKTANYTIVAGDAGKIISHSGSDVTFTFTAAATLGAGWHCWVKNRAGATDVTTFDFNGSENLDGRGDGKLFTGESIHVYCDGSNFHSVDRTIMWAGNTATDYYAQPQASGGGSIAAGLQAVSGGSDSLAVGYDTTSSHTKSSAIGYGATAANTRAMALGWSRASGADSFAAAIGTSSGSYGASGSSSVAMGSSNKATSTGSSALGGYYNIASGSAAVTLGNYNTASSTGSVVVGTRGVSNINYKYVYSGRSFGTSQGQGQYGLFQLANSTADATPKALVTDDATASSSNQIILPNNSAYAFHGTIIAREQASAGSDYASWEIKGALLRDANAASTVLGNGIQNKMYATSGASAWAIALTADTTNGGLKIEVTGAASTNIRWVATVNTSEVTY